MDRKFLVAGAALAALTLTACSPVSPPGHSGSNGTDGPNTTDPGPAPSPPEPPSADYIAWQASDIQYIAWDAKNKRYISKYNEVHEWDYTMPPVPVRLQSVDPITGDIGWRTDIRADVAILEVDYTPWPAIPSHETGARVGHIAITSGGSLGPSSHPQRTEYLEFQQPHLNIETGELMDLGDDCVGNPYGDIGLCWGGSYDSPASLVVVNENLDVVAEHETSINAVGVLELTDYLYLGASFRYSQNMAEQDGADQPFEISFLKKDDASLHTVELPAELRPNPTSEEWGRFENELKIVPLADGVLWNNGTDPAWTAISADGDIVSLEPSEHVDITAAARGGQLATADEFVSAWEEVSAADDGDLVLVPAKNPLLFEVTPSSIAWTSTGDDSKLEGEINNSFVPTDDEPMPSILVGPNAAWFQVNDQTFSLSDGSTMSELTSMKFLEHVDGLDIFSTTDHGFNESMDRMGIVVAVSNPDN